MNKIRIFRANTRLAYCAYRWVPAALADYIDELRQQARWDTAKVRKGGDV